MTSAKPKIAIAAVAIIGVALIAMKSAGPPTDARWLDPGEEIVSVPAATATTAIPADTTQAADAIRAEMRSLQTVAQDHRIAGRNAELYSTLQRLARDHGSAQAAHELALMILARLPDVPHDRAEAKSWLDQAIKGGLGLAAFDKAELLVAEIAPHEDIAALYEQAVTLGVLEPEPLLQLARLKLSGRYGVEPSIDAARDLMMRSALRGNDDAMLMLAQILSQTDSSRAEGYAWAVLAWKRGMEDALPLLQSTRAKLSEDEQTSAAAMAETFEREVERHSAGTGIVE